MIKELEKEVSSCTPNAIFEMLIDEYDNGVYLLKRSSNKKKDKKDLKDALGYAKKIKDEFIADFFADEAETAEKLFLIYIALINQTKRNEISLSHESAVSYENVVRIAEGIYKADIKAIEKAPLILEEVKEYLKRKRGNELISRERKKMRQNVVNCDDENINKLLSETVAEDFYNVLKKTRR